MAYQDIAYWKGDQYQKGVHVLPYFRAQMALSDHVNIVLGNIYGASNHNLIEPLYNPELNLTCDPEAGLQLLYDSKAFDLDVGELAELLFSGRMCIKRRLPSGSLRG